MSFFTRDGGKMRSWCVRALCHSCHEPYVKSLQAVCPSFMRSPLWSSQRFFGARTTQSIAKSCAAVALL